MAASSAPSVVVLTRIRRRDRRRRPGVVLWGDTVFIGRLLACQYLSPQGQGDLEVAPERRLLLALLEECVATLTRAAEHVRRFGRVLKRQGKSTLTVNEERVDDELSWLLDEHPRECDFIPFGDVCDMLGLDQDWVRAGILRPWLDALDNRADVPEVYDAHEMRKARRRTGRCATGGRPRLLRAVKVRKRARRALAGGGVCGDSGTTEASPT